MTYQAFVVTSIIAYVVLFIHHQDSFNLYNMVNVVTFISFALVIHNALDRREEYYSHWRVCLTTLGYTALLVGLYWYLSCQYTGNTFIFDESDPRAYERYSLVMSDMNFTEALDYISGIWEYEDWGAPMSMALLMKVVPSKLFVNVCHLIINTISAYFLFDIGKSVMSKKYAYIGTLAYTISSYNIFFIGSLRKETIMMFWVILAFFCYYRYLRTRNVAYMPGTVLAMTVIMFFRPAVTLMMGASFLTVLLFGSRQGVRRLIFSVLVIAGAFVGYALIWGIKLRYIGEGGLEDSYMISHTSTFQKGVAAAGALVGPFPTMLMNPNLLSKVPLQGVGVLFKYLLFVPYWIGFYYCLKSRNRYVLPIYSFVVTETLALAIMMELEIRKYMPHLPFAILAAFWCLSLMDRREYPKSQGLLHQRWLEWTFYCSVAVVIVTTLMWNVLRYNPGNTLF